MLILHHKPKYQIYDNLETVLQDHKTLKETYFQYHHFLKRSYLEVICESLNYNKIKIYQDDKLLDKKQKYQIIESLLEQIPKVNHELDSYSNKFYLDMANVACYHLELKHVKMLFSKIPQLFNKDLTYCYYGVENYSLVQASRKIENLHYLVMEHNHSFFKNLYNIYIPPLNRKNKDLLSAVIEKDNITQHLDYEITEITTIFKNLVDPEIVILCIKQIIVSSNKSNSNNKNKFLYELFQYYLYQEETRVVKFLFNHNYSRNNVLGFIDNNFWYDYLNEALESHFKIEYTDKYKKKLKKTQQIYYVLQYIKNHTDSFEYIKNYMLDCKGFNYNCSLLSCLLKYPKVIKIIELLELEDHWGHLYNNTEIINTLLRYGSYDTLLFLDNKLSDIIGNLTSAILGDLIDNSLCNRDIRVSQYIFDYLKKNHLEKFLETFKYNYGDLELKFLKFELSTDNKKQKLKLLYNYVDIKHIKYIILCEISPLDDIPLKKWFFKKYYDDIFYPKNTTKNEFTLLCNCILLEYNYKFLVYFLDRCSGQFNFYEFVIRALCNNYFWYDKFIQKILSYCGPLKEQSSQVQKTILENMSELNNVSSNFIKNTILEKNSNITEKDYVNLDSQGVYNDFVQFLIDQKVNFNQSVSYYNNYLLYTYHNKPKIFKALILKGYSFKPIFEYFGKPHYYNAYYPLKTDWISLYNIIRRLSFRKHFQHKKNHTHNFKSTIIDMIARPPDSNTDLPVLQKGGKLFYRDLDEMDMLMENSTVEFKNAVHIEPRELVSILNQQNNLCISQKVDGILRKEVDITDIYPQFQDTDFDLVKLDAEYIEQLDLYLIFNIRSHQNQLHSYWEDYQALKSEHVATTNNSLVDSIISTSDTQDTIIQKMNREIENILNFSQKTKHINKAKWYPKVFYQIQGDEKRRLQVLQIFIDRQKEIFSNNQNSYSMSKYLENNNIMTDGLILMNNQDKQQLYKYKPDYCMSADLLIDMKIYRCYWNRETQEWQPQDIRLDKEYPNPIKIIKQLEHYHRNPWNLTDLVPYLSQEIYYQKQKVYDSNIQDFITKCKELTNQVLLTFERQINYQKDRVLDLGCGYFNNILWKNPNIMIDGVDIDLKTIPYNNNNNKKFWIQDISQPWNHTLDNIAKYYQYDSIESDTQYKLITSLMSFHNVFRDSEGLTNLFTELNQKTNSGSQMVISFLDKDILFNDNQTHRFPDGSFMGLTPEKELLYYYSWQHIKPIKEPILSLAEITDKLSSQKWNLQEKFRGKKFKEGNMWNVVWSSFTILIFTKN